MFGENKFSVTRCQRGRIAE